MRHLSPRSKSGHAALLFVMIFPALFGIFIWGTEGARILQEKARLTDATEAGALAAVSSINYQDRATREDVFGKFVKNYFPSDDVMISVSSNETNLNSQAPTFSMEASVTEKTWFGENSFVSYGDQFTISSNTSYGGVAAKRQQSYTGFDVVILADFSKSMKSNKINEKIEILIGNLENLVKPNLNIQVSLIGYDAYVSRFLSNESEEIGRGFATNLICGSDYCPLLPELIDPVKDINIENTFSQLSLSLTTADQNDSVIAFKSNRYQPYQWCSPKNRVDKGDALAGAQGIIKNFCKSNEPISISDYRTVPLRTIPPITDKNYFTDSKGINIKSASEFQVDKDSSYAATYTGLIEARIVLNSTSKYNHKKVIFLITDGTEIGNKKSNKKIFSYLIDQGLCEKLKTYYENDKKKEISIFLLGIGYQYNNNLTRCIGDNIYPTDKFPDPFSKQTLDYIFTSLKLEETVLVR